MIYLCETNNKDAKYLLHFLNHTAVFNKLSTVLSSEEMLLFAKPIVNSQVTQWMTGLPKVESVKDFSKLSEEDKDYIADKLEEVTEQIKRKIKNCDDFELKNLTGNLFKVPTSSDIKIISTNERIFPVLVQWGCTSNKSESNSDPLSTILIRPRLSTALVSIAFFYTYGDIYAENNFYLRYLGKEEMLKTDSLGLYNRGRCKIGSKIEIYQKKDDYDCYIHTFNFEDGVNYEVKFPMVKPIYIYVIDKEGKSIQDELIKINYNGKAEDYLTNLEGKIFLNELEVGKEIFISDNYDNKSSTSYIIEKDKDTYILEIDKKYPVKSELKIIDENDLPLDNYELLIRKGDSEVSYTSDESGKIQIDTFYPGNQFKAINKSNPSNTEVFEVTENEEKNNFVFKIVNEKIKEVRIKLLNKNGKAIPNITIDFHLMNNKKTCVTDQDGYCYLPYDIFNNKEKVKLKLNLKQIKT